MPSPSHVLPQELSDHILDFLHDHQETLRSCNLVSHSWSNSARYHMYHDFIVAATKHEDGVDEFVQFLSEHTDIHGYICNLTIAAPSHGFESAVSVEGIRSVLKYLDNLRTISLEGLSFFERSPASAGDLDSQSHNHLQVCLRQLTLTRIFWPHPLRSSILGVLDLFGQTDELHLSRFEYSTMASANFPNSENTASLRARSVYLEFPFFDLGLPLVKALIHVLHFPSLESLTVACFAMSQASTAGRLISQVEQTLHHFTLDLRTLFAAGPYEGGSWDDLKLGSCASLQSLTIRLSLSHTHRHIEYWQQLWHAALCVLSNAPLSITSITFHISCHCQFDDAFLTSVDWVYLNQMLLRLGKLETVMFILQMEESPKPSLPSPGAHIIRKELDWLDRRDMLSISDTLHSCN